MSDTKPSMFESFYKELASASAKVSYILILISFATMTATIVNFVKEEIPLNNIGESNIEMLAELEKINYRMSAYEKRNKPSQDVSIKVIDLSRLRTIENKQNIIENALQNDIEKALSIAIIRRDIDEIKISYKERILVLENRIESLNNTFLWTIGSIVTILLAGFGLIGVRRASAK